MTSIGANTKHTITVPKKKTGKNVVTIGGKRKVVGKGKVAARRGAVAPPLSPATLCNASAIDALKALDTEGRKNKVAGFLRQSCGEQALVDKSTPHAASTTRDRQGAAADVAVAAKELGVAFVLKECGVLLLMQQMLFPMGIETLIPTDREGGLRPSPSAVSLTSMDDTTVTTVNSGGTDTKRGKTTPANAREGSLLLIRALCEIVGRRVEPYVVGAFLAAALDECGSSSSAIREAAEDSAVAMIRVANPWAFPRLICPLLLQSLNSAEWRVKFSALERLAQCATTSPLQVHRLLPELIPAITDQVWDTKMQVSKAANATLLAICQTNRNPDVASAIPEVVNAICKPAETFKAVEELMGTTFVASVDASTLSILCPVLARALKEKLAIRKRAACIVISNMSRLVETPEAVAPFGPLLVPELQKVAHNVQFEDIRDEALKALKDLTKALGASLSSPDESDIMAEEQARVEAEQKRIQEERDAEKKKEEDMKKKEEEERRRFKEAMDAQRELAKVEEEAEKKKKKEEEAKRDKEKRSVKGKGGKCQSCGLKKCKKSCMFFSG